MQCPRCQVETPVGADFCPECGAGLAGVCPQCGTQNALCRRLLGWPASESGRLCRGDRGHGRGHRRRRALMLAILRIVVR
jgi:hypothetical protein